MERWKREGNHVPLTKTRSTLRGSDSSQLGISSFKQVCRGFSDSMEACSDGGLFKVTTFELCSYGSFQRKKDERQWRFPPYLFSFFPHV